MTDEVTFDGHLDHEQVSSRLGNVPGPKATTLLVDCSTLESYDSTAREAFVDWNRIHKEDFQAVAVVTQRTTWHMLVSTMSIASGQKMKAFAELGEARSWLQEQAG